MDGEEAEGVEERRRPNKAEDAERRGAPVTQTFSSMNFFDPGGGLGKGRRGAGGKESGGR